MNGIKWLINIKFMISINFQKTYISNITNYNKKLSFYLDKQGV